MEDMIANIVESMPGFKFHPSENELLLQHLKPKIEGTYVEHSCVVPEVKVCQYDPWHLPKIFSDLSLWKSLEGAREWIFFCPTKRKYLNSQRSERTTPSGYWKVTGVNHPVETEDGALIGIKKTLVFYKGRVPKGKRTNWVMHEYHIDASCLSDDSYGDQLPYVACRVKLKKDKNGVTTEDYPTEDSNYNSPYTSAAADHTHVNEGDSSLYNTPNNVTPEHHQATVDPYGTAYEYEISLDNLYGSLPNLVQLDHGATSEHNAHDGRDAFDYRYMPPPQALSPWNADDGNSSFCWDYSYGSYN